MTIEVDLDLLDNEEALEAADAGGMLRQVATGAAQVRESAALIEPARFASFAAEGRPRAVVVAGMGGSGIAGDILSAVCGSSCLAPVVVVRDYVLPSWVGAADVVMAVSCSGSTEETIAVAREAVRRGCRVLGVGSAPSLLADVAQHGHGTFVPIRPAGQPRASMWALSIPPLLAARELRLLPLPDQALEDTATRLEQISIACRPSSDSASNPGKALAMELAGSIPVVWGSSSLAGTAAYRFACQLAENAKYPSLFGELPEANHNQVVTFDGTLAGGGSVDDIFRDRVEDPMGDPRLRLVVLRDSVEHPQVAKRREISMSLAEERGIPVSVVAAEGMHPLERLASLVGLVDYASVYLALALGVDPTPVNAIQELKARISE